MSGIHRHIPWEQNCIVPVGELYFLPEVYTRFGAMSFISANHPILPLRTYIHTSIGTSILPYLHFNTSIATSILPYLHLHLHPSKLTLHLPPAKCTILCSCKVCTTVLLMRKDSMPGFSKKKQSGGLPISYNIFPSIYIYLASKKKKLMQAKPKRTDRAHVWYLIFRT